MAFDDIDSSTSEASLRLGKLNNTPSTAELDFALAQAKKNTSAVIELPWKTPSSPTFVLKVACSDPESEANWILYQGETADAAVLWSFDSDDTSLIESLIVAECAPDRSLQALSGNGGEAATQSAPATAGGYTLGAGDPGSNGSSLSSNGGNLSAVASLTASPEASHVVSHVQLPAAVEIEMSLVDHIEKNLRDVETGLQTRAAFFFHLLREHKRYQSTRAPLAVIIFELHADYGSNKIMPLPDRALKEAFRRFQAAMRSIDILANYEDKQYAFLLSGASSNDAVQFGKKIEKAMTENPLQPGIDRDQAILRAGVAGIPDTCDNPGVLLAACLTALEQAKERHTSIALFPSLARP